MSHLEIYNEELNDLLDQVRVCEFVGVCACVFLGVREHLGSDSYYSNVP